jgi:hypothetical protein
MRITANSYKRRTLLKHGAALGTLAAPSQAFVTHKVR